VDVIRGLCPAGDDLDPVTHAASVAFLLGKRGGHLAPSRVLDADEGDPMARLFAVLSHNSLCGRHQYSRYFKPLWSAIEWYIL